MSTIAQNRLLTAEEFFEFPARVMARNRNWSEGRSLLCRPPESYTALLVRR